VVCSPGSARGAKRLFVQSCSEELSYGAKEAHLIDTTHSHLVIDCVHHAQQRNQSYLHEYGVGTEFSLLGTVVNTTNCGSRKQVRSSTPAQSLPDHPLFVRPSIYVADGAGLTLNLVEPCFYSCTSSSISARSLVPDRRTHHYSSTSLW